MVRGQKVRGPRPKVRGPRPKVRGPRSKLRGPRPKVRGPRPKVRGPRPKVRGSRPKVRGSRPGRDSWFEAWPGFLAGIRGSRPPGFVARGLAGISGRDCGSRPGRDFGPKISARPRTTNFWPRTAIFGLEPRIFGLEPRRSLRFEAKSSWFEAWPGFVVRGLAGIRGSRPGRDFGPKSRPGLEPRILGLEPRIFWPRTANFGLEPRRSLRFKLIYDREV